MFYILLVSISGKRLARIPNHRCLTYSLLLELQLAQEIVTQKALRRHRRVGGLMQQVVVENIELIQQGWGQALAPQSQHQKSYKALSKHCTQSVEVKLTFADGSQWSGQRCGCCCHLFLINLVA